jgi:hypothetical protein
MMLSPVNEVSAVGRLPNPELLISLSIKVKSVTSYRFIMPLDTAPVRTVLPHVSNSITRSINHKTLVSDSSIAEGLREHIDVDNFINGLVVLRLQVAWVV